MKHPRLKRRLFYLMVENRQGHREQITVFYSERRVATVGWMTDGKHELIELKPRARTVDEVIALGRAA